MVTEEELAVVQRRILLKETAKARGRGFTRVEAERFIGGGTAVSLLRSATRKGLTTSVLQAQQEAALEEPLTKATAKDLLLTPAGLRKRTRSELTKDIQSRFNELNIPIFVGAGGEISAGEIRKGLREFGIGGKLAAEFVPETKTELLKFATLGLVSSLLLGTPGLVGQVSKGVIATLGTGIAVDPDLPVETRIAGGLIAVAPFVPELLRFGKKKVPTFQEFKASQTSLLRTKKGQARFAELESFFKKEGKKKSDLQKALDEASDRLTRRVEQKGKKVSVRSTSQSEKLDFLRASLERARQTRDPNLRKKQIEGLVKFTKSELGEVQAKNLFKELIAQEGFLRNAPRLKSTLTKEVARPFVAPIPESQVKIEDITTSRFDLIPKADTTGLSKAGIRNLETTLKNQQRNNERISRSKSINAKRKEAFQSMTADNQKKNQLRITAQKEKDALRQLQSSRLKQGTNQAEMQRFIQLQRFRVLNAQASLKRFVQGSGSRLRIRQRIRKTKLRVPLPFAEFGKPKKKVLKAFPKLKKFQPFAKISPSSKNKFVKLGKPTTLPKAKRRLFKELDRTISATGLIKRNGKVVRPKTLPKVFRFSRNKKTPNRIVEKRKFRLSSKIERSSIQKAKKLSKAFKKRL